MTENKAAWQDGPNLPLRVGELEMPKSEAGRIIVRARAVAVNPIDWKIQDFGVLFDKSWPMVLGVDVAGDVVDAGEQIEHIKKGDRVFGHGDNQITHRPTDGSFALYSSVPAATAAVIPASISYAQASVLPLAFDTAATGLYLSSSDGYLGLPYPTLKPGRPDKVIVVWGGSSSVGALGIQLAVLSGARVLAVASPHNFEFCKACGSSEMFDYNSSTVVDDIVNAIKSSPETFAGIYDGISTHQSYRFVFGILDRLGGGNLATVLKPPPEVPENIKAGHIYAINQVTHPLWTDYITRALESGLLRCMPEPLIIGQGLEKIQEGLNRNKQGVSARKVVIEL